MQQEISMPEKIDSLEFYEKILKQCLEYYNKEIEKPIISFKNVKWIDPCVLPNLLNLGLLLKQHHKELINLYLPQDFRMVQFLKESNFLYLSRDNIYEFNEEILDIANFYHNKEYREEHKIVSYSPFLDYYKEKDINKQIDMRSELFEAVRYGEINNKFRTVIKDKKVLMDSQVEIILDILCELLCNGMLYSKSTTFAYVQTTKFKTTISISDLGIGFYNSLNEKVGFEYIIRDKYENYYNKYPFIREFIHIIEVLNYSMKSNRENLWRLKNIIVNNGGTVRIHNNTTQVIFTSNRCANCNKTPVECFECILKRYNKNINVSPLRIFNHNFNGVHIEVDLINGGIDKK